MKKIMKMFAKRPGFVLLGTALMVLPFMVSCSDYEDMIDEDYEEWEVLHLGDDEESSSSDSLMSSSSEESDDPVPDDSLSSGADSDKKSSSSSAPADSDTTKSPAAGYDASAGTLTDARDKQVYKTIVVGTGADARVWMAENLNYNYNRGTASSICYENKTENCETDGRIYLWSAAVDSAAAFSKEADGCGRGKKCTMADVVRGACPEGWHLPSKTELEELIAFAGGKSKSADSVRKAFKNNGKSTNIWSSAQHNVLYAFNMSLFDGEKVAKVDSVDKKKSFSVRCVLNYDLPQDSSALSSSSVVVFSSSAYVPIDSSVFDAEANTLVDLRDNEKYRTVTIGIADYAQTWMAENLRFKSYAMNGKDTVYTSRCSADNEKKCDSLGQEYMWSAAVDSAAVFSDAAKDCGYEKRCYLDGIRVRGVCPAGWHVPDTSEWYKLFKNVGGESTAGYKLKAKAGWPSNYNGSDEFGFSVLWGGNSFASSGDDGLAYAVYFAFVGNSKSVAESSSKLAYVNLRCIKNVSVEVPDTTDFMDYKYGEGEDKSVYNKTLKQVKDWRDGRIYRTTTIGTQVWMAENLKYRYLQKNASGDSTSMCYLNRQSNCDSLGRLYRWSAAIDSVGKFSVTMKGCGNGVDCSAKSGRVRGVCPLGWHLASHEEWMTLYKYVGMSSSKLKAKTTWRDGTNGTDDYGFSMYASNEWNYTYEALFWTSTDRRDEYALYWGFRYNDDVAYMNDGQYVGADGVITDLTKYEGLPVRCVYDQTVELSSSSVASSSSVKSSSSKSEPKSSSNEQSSSSAKPVSSAANSSSSVGASSGLQIIEDVSSIDSKTGKLVDGRDGKSYNVATIGTQTWMGENLNYEYKVNTAESFCYGDDTANCTKYGRLYTWSAAMDSAKAFSTSATRGICPEGWHIPTSTEWQTMLDFVSASGYAGTYLKSTTGWDESIETGVNGEDDKYGFTVYPSGTYMPKNGYINMGVGVFYWSATQVKTDSISIVSFTYYWQKVEQETAFAGNGNPVRCVKDE